MDPNNLGYSKDEFNNFCVNEIIIEKSASHETGKYNEIKITNGLISVNKKESSSSKSEKTKTAMAIGGSIGMAGGIGGVIIKWTASIKVDKVKKESYPLFLLLFY